MRAGRGLYERGQGASEPLQWRQQPGPARRPSRARMSCIVKVYCEQGLIGRGPRRACGPARRRLTNDPARPRRSAPGLCLARPDALKNTMTDFDARMQDLLTLSHALGDPGPQWAILGEGNTSTRVDAETFLVKASGSQLGTLDSSKVAHVRFAPVLDALSGGQRLDDAQVKELLAQATLGPAGAVPSTETLMHAFLLTLPGAHFVGHTHVVSINGLMCSQRGWAFMQSGRRLFPDEIVVCGVAPCCVPYVNPGIPLARAVQTAAAAYLDTWGTAPKTIYLQNHGFIALGRSAGEVHNIHQMADKAARILAAALAIGEPSALTPENVQRIYTWPAEHYRQRALGLSTDK